MTSLIVNLEEGVEESFRFPAFEERDVDAGPGPPARSDAQLAEFQQDAVRALHENFEKRRAATGLLCLPTGAGKTRTTLEWTLRHQVARGRRVVWVTHRIDLLNQVHRDLVGLSWLLQGLRRKLSISRYDGHGADLRGAVVLATAAALLRGPPSPKDLSRGGFKLGAIVYDEPDPALAGEVLEVLERIQADRKALLLGVTSTPLRPDVEGALQLPAFFGGQVVYERSFRDLLHVGFLARPIFVRVPLEATDGATLPSAELDLSRQGPDLTQALLSSLGQIGARDEEIVDHWIGGATRYGKTLVFACDTEHADSLAHRFAARGVLAAALHGRLDEAERAARLRAFREGAVRVLTHFGSLAEGELVHDIRTVLLARPTKSVARLLRMIGCAARGPRLVPGKDYFNVVECVDGFRRLGLPLAGPVVARWLESDITREMQPARAPGDSEVRRRGAAACAALAWLRARGLDPQEYAFWGELLWLRQDGAERSVVVLAGSLGAVEQALALVGPALASEHWRAAEEHAVILEASGALRAVDWNDMLFDVRRTKRLPELRRVTDLRPTAEDDQASGALLELARVALERGVEEAASSCAGAWEQQPPLRARFLSAAALQSEMLRLYPQMYAQARLRQSQPPPPPAWEDVEAFVNLGVAVACADGELHEAEHGTILIGARKVFQLEAEADLQRLGALVATVEASPGDVERAARRLRSDAPFATVLCVFDWLLHVGIADSKFVEPERVCLGGVAALLGLSQDEYRRRCSWYLKIDPSVPIEVMPGTRTCAACGASFPDEARFCGECGVSLGE
ncbi:MAG: TerB family tellurite resistance protein [Deltaproteobacteria bacterium]|nr:TerB family tellurite resistance protein [Deltaproteobacteria bacterium]